MQENSTGTQIPRKGDRNRGGIRSYRRRLLDFGPGTAPPLPVFVALSHTPCFVFFVFVFFSSSYRQPDKPPSLLPAEGAGVGGVAIGAGDYDMRVVCMQRCQVACDAYKVHSKQDSARLPDRHVENILRTVTHN